MAKNVLINPSLMRASGDLQFARVPVNHYNQSLKTEREVYGDAALEKIGRDMILVREFELMLNSIKREGSYKGIAYAHAGPAHLSIGQEATAVGQAFALDPIDKVFGSHRSHGEVIAKGLSAISKSDQTQLATALEQWANGETWAVVKNRMSEADAEDQAINYLLYGMTAETFGRSTGFNRGLGGSMHAFFPPLGIFPNNAIVGGSAPIATGAALYNRLQNQPGIIVANIGDASSGTGPVWESLNLASMAQLETLMDERHRGGLPIVFFFVNNFYGMGGQPLGETMGFDRLSRIGAGVNARSMHAQTIDGLNPFAVIHGMNTARQHLLEGTGPVLIDCQTYRQSGHSPSDASSYRSKEETEMWLTVDPVDSFFGKLVDEGVVSSSRQAELKDWAEGLIRRTVEVAIDPVESPRLSLRRDPNVMASMTFNNTKVDLANAPVGETLVPLHELPQRVSIGSKSRSGVQDGKVLSGSKAVTFRDAIFEALTDQAAADDRVTFWGEENRDWGGAFGVYRGLTEFLPYRRLFNTPISEAAIVGSGVGFAMSGGRPVVELMYADFIGRAGDEIFNQMAKWQAMSGGLLTVPMVLRVSVGAKYGAQHSQDWSSMVASVPGLKVVFPATAHDAKGLMASALSGNDPVVFFESQRLYDSVETLFPAGIPRESYETPIGVPRIVREGADLTFLTVGAALYRAIDAANELEAKWGIKAEVIDARSMVPFDYNLLLESVQKTGRLVCISDASVRGSWMNTVATKVSTEAFDYLDAPIVVLGTRNWIAPPAELEWEFFVTPADIIDAVHARILPLEGHREQDGPLADGSIEEAALGI